MEDPQIDLFDTAKWRSKIAPYVFLSISCDSISKRCYFIFICHCVCHSTYTLFLGHKIGSPFLECTPIFFYIGSKNCFFFNLVLAKSLAVILFLASFIVLHNLDLGALNFLEVFFNLIFPCLTDSIPYSTSWTTNFFLKL